MNKKALLLIIFAICFAKANSQSTHSSKKMEWFGDAKLGIFIHWGIYSVNGISESWSFFNNYLNHEAYMKQLQGFSASKYNPQQWVEMIKQSGAKYAVITTKHHDGVALWDTKTVNAVSTLKNSAAKRDLITPFVASLKNAGLKTGLYFSLPDWSYPDYDVFTRERKRYSLKDEPHRWNLFLNYYQAQLKELSIQFKPDLLWFDGDWEHSSAEWQTDKVRKSLLGFNPNLIINSRLDMHGDYETPEQGVPVIKPNAPYWELCYTMNDSWGYQPYDKKYKSPNMIIRTLVDCISMGGNLLLDIGPKPDGTIPVEQQAILKGLGRWTNKHPEAIYGTTAGIEKGHFIGKTSLSKDKKTLFLYLDSKDNSGVFLKSISSKIVGLSVIGYAGKIDYKKTEKDNYLIKIPTLAYDKDVTVVKIRFNEAIRLGDLSEPAIALNDIYGSPEGNTNLTIRKIASAVNYGLNPLKDSPLTYDGFELKVASRPLDKNISAWLIKNAEALYQTRKGISDGHFDGNTALSDDLKTLYLFVEGEPTGPISIKGLKNGISRIRVVGEGTMLDHAIYNKLYWSKVPGIVYIDIPKDRLDKNITVIAVLLDSPIDLYREKVTAIESN